jgi:hypothetical protein
MISVLIGVSFGAGDGVGVAIGVEFPLLSVPVVAVTTTATIARIAIISTHFWSSVKNINITSKIKLKDYILNALHVVFEHQHEPTFTCKQTE